MDVGLPTNFAPDDPIPLQIPEGTVESGSDHLFTVSPEDVQTNTLACIDFPAPFDDPFKSNTKRFDQWSLRMVFPKAHEEPKHMLAVRAAVDF
jgi:hypothetical protein